MASEGIETPINKEHASLVDGRIKNDEDELLGIIVEIIVGIIVRESQNIKEKDT